MMRRVLVWLVVLTVAAAAVWWIQARPRQTRVTVYFVGIVDNAGTLAPVERIAEGRGTDALLRAAVEALLAGPTAAERAKGLTTEIPLGVRLRGLDVRDGVAVIDLTEGIAAGGGSFSMRGRLWQIVYTGTQFGARQVRILIEGAERQALGGEGVLIDRPIGRPPAFPRF